MQGQGSYSHTGGDEQLTLHRYTYTYTYTYTHTYSYTYMLPAATSNRRSSEKVSRNSPASGLRATGADRSVKYKVQKYKVQSAKYNVHNVNRENA